MIPLPSGKVGAVGAKAKKAKNGNCLGEEPTTFSETLSLRALLSALFDLYIQKGTDPGGSVGKGHRPTNPKVDSGTRVLALWVRRVSPEPHRSVLARKPAHRGSVRV